jgi:nitrogen-specific signal transduction histidine kinase/CheY-like chemotaxis protein
LAILRDMTEVKKMKEHQRQSQKMESLARLAGGIAHDFNNILAAIYGYTELMKMQIPPQSKTMEHLEQILFAAERAKRLVHQIVQFIRPEHTEDNIINPSDVVSETLIFMRSSLPATIDLQSRLSSTQGVAIDKEQLSRVVVNLCTNAAHAMEDEGGTIMVSLIDLDLDDTERVNFPDLKLGAYVELKVGDSGHGMDTETQKLIFEPYFTTKDPSKGSGLGLSIVHGIVKACKGVIRIESQPGKGATFQILLPAAAAAAEPALQSGHADKFSCDIGSCILFIDDEPALADLGCKSLEKFGCKVVAETDPMVALRKFKEQPEAFDLVITDMTMPKMNGDKLAKELLSTRPDIPIILCTGFNQDIDNEATKRIGIKALLKKPFKIDVLAEIVSQVLQQK